LATVTPIEYGGNVWCVTVPTGAFVARRNGKIFITGNSGFPKGQNIAKGIEKLGLHEEAKKWEGWNTNLKPAYEPIIMARKPLDGTVVNNVLKHGVGGLNIDACRVGTSENLVFNHSAKTSRSAGIKGNASNAREGEVWNNTKGRYPANIILDGSESVEALFPYSKSGSGQKNQFNSKGSACGFYKNNLKPTGREWQGSEGSASRYFYHAKASKKDRDEGVNGLNPHPTVKPTQLMRYLVKLVTPHGGLVLDPFMGSGSTGKACMLEGMRFIGMDLNEEYVKIAESRIEHASQKMSLLNYEEID